MRSEATENYHLTNIVQHYALANPAIRASVVVVEGTLGEDAAGLAGIVLIPASLAANLPGTILDQAVATTENIDNAERAIGIPLAALIRQVVDFYSADAMPLPEKIVPALLYEFSTDEIANVRYVVSNNGASIADLINYLNTEFGESYGENHAVTANNIIVFGREPSFDASDLWFIAHEIQHTVQYSDLGIDGFSAEYTLNATAMENAATERADKLLAKVLELMRLARALAPNP